ncbi:hypothetical protein [Halioxenophilus aromaticivorans]|uniref:Uncharacterized protein n=1 Tax=Halioxenophilus aromaticivorans TaxID=1306992 RepID=A0AAV3U5E0_9ALTE
MSNKSTLPTTDNLPYPPDKIPQTIEKAIVELTKVLEIDLSPKTAKSIQTIQILCGIVLYRHLDSRQRFEVMSGIQDPTVFAPSDWGKLRSLCTDVLIQPRWHLWSLTTNELDTLLKTQKNLQGIFNILGYSVSVSSAVDLWSNSKKP